MIKVSTLVINKERINNLSQKQYSKIISDWLKWFNAGDENQIYDIYSLSYRECNDEYRITLYKETL